jgi:hypothetical protein
MVRSSANRVSRAWELTASSTAAQRSGTVASRLDDAFQALFVERGAVRTLGIRDSITVQHEHVSRRERPLERAGLRLLKGYTGQVSEQDRASRRR